MIPFKKSVYFRFIAYVLVSVLFIQADFLLAVTQEESLELQFQRAKTDFANKEYQSAKDRLERLDFVYKNIPGRTSDSNRKYGETLLWLAATREVLCLDKKVIAETYKQAVDLLGKGYIVGDPGLNTLDMCRKAFNIKTPKDTTKMIEKVGQNTGKKKFPWLLVGGIVVAGVVAVLLLKKKPQRTLTVSVGEGVEGTPVSGTSSHKNGTTVSYNYTLKTGYTGLVVKIDGNEVAASGSLKMDANHTLTATATKRYTLTVTKGVGVDGTPVSGSTQYNSGESVSYNYTLQSGYKDLVVKLDGLEVSPSGTIVMDKDHTLTATSGKTFKLTVTKGNGVIGLPDTGTFYYKDGETVNYSYSLQAGFSDLEVRLDGNLVTASGVITMDQDHVLVVTSGKTFNLTTSVSVGVDGSPESGTTNYPVGTTVNYSYNLKDEYKNLVVTLDGNPVLASGIITMNADHTLIATATGVNKFQLSVTVGTGVQGTPVQGTADYNDGDKVDYSYSLQNGFTDLVVKLDGNVVPASGTITMDRAHVLVASSGKTFTLTSTVNDGVSGEPATGAQVFKEGETTTYNYSLQSGYRNLVVKLDGTTVSASGTITMNANHTLTASATKEWTLAINKGTGVEGIPSQTTVYGNGEIVPYSYTLQSGYTNLVVTLDGTIVGAGGTVIMNGNHTLTVTAVKQWTLTVTRGTGIDGDPATGAAIYTQGQTINYSYTLQSGYQDLVVLLDGNPVAASGTITMNQDHVLSAVCGKSYALTTTKGTGVDGSPNTGAVIYTEGDTLSYSYSLQSGYTDLIVTLDGNTVAASGTITMNQNHTLIATAKKICYLTVTLGTGVTGTPSAGSYTKKYGDVVSYGYSAQTGYTDIQVLFDGQVVSSAGSVTMTGNHTLAVTAKKQYNLTVSKNTGVSGTPVTGTTTYKEGDTVSYSYAAQTGYTDLVVTLDEVVVPASGTITMNANHSLIATATKQYTLTVTKGTGIDGTPITGTYTYKQGENASYNYSLQSGYTDLVVKLDNATVPSSNVITMNADHTLVASATKQYTLAVTKGSGVDGTPDTGSTIYKDGDTVTYNYTLQSGYRNLVVTLDGTAVAASGSFSMTKNRALVASATKEYTLTVTRNTGVSGTPATGSTAYADGASVTYSYTLQTGYKNLVVTIDGTPVAASGTITMSANHTLVASATPKTQYTLTVTLGAGVDGTPTATDQYYEGDSVNYSYTLQGGYTDLVVTLDGTTVAASGSITMDANHTLVISATAARTPK